MNRIELFICIVVNLFCFTSHAQDFEDYQRNIDLATEAYEIGDFLESAQYYSEAFKAAGGLAINRDAYNAACSWALANNPESAFDLLKFITTPGMDAFTDFETLINDTDFNSLHDYPQWDLIVAQTRENYSDRYHNLDQALVEKLSVVYQNDQEDRQVVAEFSSSYGEDSKEVQTLKKNIAYNDSVNQIIVAEILDEHGWLGPEIVSYEGSKALFLVVQHAALEMQLKYLPMMREAVKADKARAEHLALLEDRVALRQGEMQIYGSQVGYDETLDRFFLEPTIDPENLDQRRLPIGLVSISEYLSLWDTTWDLEEHKSYWKELE